MKKTQDWVGPLKRCVLDHCVPNREVSLHSTASAKCHYAMELINELNLNVPGVYVGPSL